MNIYAVIVLVFALIVFGVVAEEALNASMINSCLQAGHPVAECQFKRDK